MMATTELHKVPDTIQSRVQVFELRTISSRMIVDQLRHIADTEGISIDDGSLGMIVREAEGSMRDAQRAFDQVIAFAGDRIGADDVSTALGLVGRDLLFDMVEAVANEDAGAIFELIGRAVEAGHDLGRVCRDLSFAARDLMLISIDASRLQDPEVAAEDDRERLAALAARFSREDLLRAFDLLSDAATEIKTAAQPRYHVEMALVRWAHLRKLVPLTDLIDQLKGGGAGSSSPPARPAASTQTARATSEAPPRAGVTRPQPVLASPQPAKPSPVTLPPAPKESPESAASFKEAFLGEVRSERKALYEMCLNHARRIVVDGDRMVVAFSPGHRTHQQQIEKNREWLESLASRLAGRKMSVATVQDSAEAAPAPAAAAPSEDKKARLKAEALSDSGVQAMLDVFGGEIGDVEEM
jgi:DNA polymerase-3 subunit gamma/tau